VADDHEEVEVGQLAVLGLVGPVVAGVAAEQDDLENAAVPSPRLRASAPALERGVELRSARFARARRRLLV
jgi:hypothetical protein